jgi:hypothetical protein
MPLSTSVRGARLAETSGTTKQGGTISLYAAVPTRVKHTGPKLIEKEPQPPDVQTL